MKISRNDWLFIAMIIAVVAVFVAISGKEKTRKYLTTTIIEAFTIWPPRMG